jgi:hypothetical protein
MPPSDTATSTQHTRVLALAGALPINPLAKNPRRNYLYIRNNGMNAGSFWFDQATDSGQSITLGALGSWTPQGTKVPIDRVYFQSVLGTTFAIVEGFGPALTTPGAPNG